jgi:hypothetical protein
MSTHKLLLGVALLSVSAFAADIDGKWSGSIDAPDGPVTINYTFKAEGAVLTGTTTGPDGAEVKIAKGTVADNKIAFEVTIDFGGMAFTIPYKGEQAGDNLKLTLDFAGMPVEIAAKRVKASAIDGKWSGSVDFGGNAVEVGFTFKSEGATLTGTTTGPDGMETKISNGKLDGNKVSFDVTVDFGGTPLKIDYKGEVAGDDLKLTLDFAGMPFEIAVKKQKA